MAIVIGGYIHCKEASQKYDLNDLFSRIIEGQSTNFTLRGDYENERPHFWVYPVDEFNVGPALARLLAEQKTFIAELVDEFKDEYVELTPRLIRRAIAVCLDGLKNAIVHHPDIIVQTAPTDQGFNDLTLILFTFKNLWFDWYSIAIIDALIDSEEFMSAVQHEIRAEWSRSGRLTHYESFEVQLESLVLSEDFTLQSFAHLNDKHYMCLNVEQILQERYEERMTSIVKNFWVKNATPDDLEKCIISSGLLQRISPSSHEKNEAIVISPHAMNDLVNYMASLSPYVDSVYQRRLFESLRFEEVAQAFYDADRGLTQRTIEALAAWSFRAIEEGHVHISGAHRGIHQALGKQLGPVLLEILNTKYGFSFSGFYLDKP